MLAGLSIMYSRRVPPCFWANPGAAAIMTPSNPLTAMTANSSRFILLPPLAGTSQIPAIDPLCGVAPLSWRRLARNKFKGQGSAVWDAVEDHPNARVPLQKVGDSVPVAPHHGEVITHRAASDPMEMAALVVIGQSKV